MRGEDDDCCQDCRYSSHSPRSPSGTPSGAVSLACDTVAETSIPDPLGGGGAPGYSVLLRRPFALLTAVIVSLLTYSHDEEIQAEFTEAESMVAA